MEANQENPLVDRKGSSQKDSDDQEAGHTPSTDGPRQLPNMIQTPSRSFETFQTALKIYRESDSDTEKTENDKHKSDSTAAGINGTMEPDSDNWNTYRDDSFENDSGNEEAQCYNRNPHADDDSDAETPEEPNPWYLAPIFNHYWKSYNLAMSWYRHHQEVTSQITQMHRARKRFFGVNDPPVSLGRGREHPAQYSAAGSQERRPKSSKGAMKRKRRRKRLSQEKKLRLRAQSKRSASESLDDNAEEPLFEMEITPEMKEFFAKSAEYRKQRAEEKKDEDSDDYINLTEVTVNSKRITKAAPTERPGLRRTEQMKMLYGSGAAMIHGMETALQLNFDRNFDIKTPKLWPQLPLNITFHNQAKKST